MYTLFHSDTPILIAGFKHIYMYIYTIDGFTFSGQSQGVDLVQLLLLMLKNIRSCFSQSERSVVRLPFDCAFALWKYM